MRSRRVYILFFFLALGFSWPGSTRAMGKGHGVEVRLASPRQVTSEPGKILTASFQVVNKTGEEEEFVEELHLPPGWQPIIPPLPFKLKLAQLQVRIISFLIPQSTPSGSYEIGYTLKGLSNYVLQDRDFFTVVILPLAKIERLVEGKSEVLVAGDPHVVKMRYINRGNGQVRLRFIVEGSPPYPCTIQPLELTLDPGRSGPVQFEFATDAKLNQKLLHIFKIKAEVEDSLGKKISVDQTLSAEILPRMTGAFDPFHNLPVKLRLIGLSGKGEQGVQGEFSGSGTLDEEGTRRLDFLFRGPDGLNKGIFGERDEYRFSYGDALLNLHLGDRTYSLSTLTENYFYGRGAESNLYPGRFGLGVFYLETRWDQPQRKEIGSFLEHRFTPELSLRGNVLKKDFNVNGLNADNSAQIYSLEARIGPYFHNQLDLEYAYNQNSQATLRDDSAYRFKLGGWILDQINYTLEKIRAGPGYFGSYNDVDHQFGTVNFPILRNLIGNFSFRNLTENLDLSPLRFSANQEASYQGGVYYSFPFGTNLSLNYEDFRKKDRLRPDNYNFEEKVFKLGLGHNFSPVSLQGYIERGRLVDCVKRNEENNLEAYSLYAFLNAGKGKTLGAYAHYGNERYVGSLDLKLTSGLSAAWQVFEPLWVQLSYQRNLANVEKNQSQDTLFSTITYTFVNQSDLSLKGYYSRLNNGRQQEEYSLTLAYTIPLGIPVARKKGIGMVSGRVYDEENPDRPPLPNVILTANGAIAVTDQKGEFIFPALKPGNYLIRVDKGSIGLNRLPSRSLPFKVEVRGGETTRTDIGIVRSARINGRIVRFVREEGGQDPFKEAEVLKDVLVILSDEKLSVQAMTDERGEFQFEDLYPGPWKVKVFDDNLPNHHYLETPEFSFELKPGGEETAVVRILPKIRTIKFIDGGVIRPDKKDREGDKKR